MARRRARTDALTVIYWRDIPAQITASMGGTTGKAMLSPRFQHAIDRAATVADLTETSAYVAQWRRIDEPLPSPPPDPATNGDSAPRPGDPDTMAARRADELDELYPRDRLEALVANGGVDPAAPPGP